MISPHVTIGMPVFNGGASIELAVQSLLAQTFTDIEIVISDNASTDETQLICERIASVESRVRYIRQGQNLGARDNFLATLTEASGKYFMWAAHDDLWAAAFIQTLRAPLEADPACAFALPRARIVSKALGPLGHHRGHPLPMIELPEREERVLSFTSLPFSSHKDNMVYGLWKLADLKRVISDLKDTEFGLQYLIGGPMNEYALSNYRGAFIDNILFEKNYRIVAPGHVTHELATVSSNIYRTLFKRPRPKSNFDIEQYKVSLRLVLEMAGFGSEFVDEAISISLTNNFRRA